MTEPKSAPTQQQPTNIMVYVGGLVVAGLLVYFSFMAVNSFGLKEKTAEATVTGKGYRAAGKTYTTQKIGNRMLTVPQTTPEAYILELDVAGKPATCAVSRETYERVDAGDRVTAVYVRKRITGGTQVISISP